MKNIKIILMGIFVMINVATINVCKAEYVGLKTLNDAPRIALSVNKNKYTDVILAITDNEGIDESKIKLYAVSNDNKKTLLTNNDIKSIKVTKYSDDKKKKVQLQYTIADSYLNQTTKKFYISVTEDSGMIIHSYFRIVNKETGYAADYAPRIKDITVQAGVLSVVVKDAAGTKKAVIYDLNNENKVVKSVTKLPAGEAAVQVSLSDLKKGTNNKYKIKVYAQDDGKNAIAAIRTMEFLIDEAANRVISVSSDTKITGSTFNQKIELAGKKYNLYKQHDPRWSNKQYNSTKTTGGSMNANGCGPTSCAIILSGYGYNVTPYEIGTKLINNVKNTDIKNKRPSSMENMKIILESYNRTVIRYKYNSDYVTTYQQMKAALEKGHQLIVYVGLDSDAKYYKNFTEHGYHFVTVLAIDSSNKKNKVFVGNPSLASGWFDLETLVNARGYNHNSTMVGWLEIY